MFVEQGRQCATIVLTQLLQELMLGERPFDKEGVDEHQTVLEQLETEGGDLLLFAAISGQDALAAIAEKTIGSIPAFDHVQTCLHFVAQTDGRQVLTEVDRLFDFPNSARAL